jgi:hypothetical protein
MIFNEVNEKHDKFTKMLKISFKDHIQTKEHELIYDDNLNIFSFDLNIPIFSNKNA